ncbi:hypothetical protein [Armatimonas sp.]|uniref:hypothetical protein n=1 Tax=Armatimonas sp. TaxID=1872638 RepID=UPI00286A5258|nr:hypothetical protein [Armatimonas sp.]
MQTQKQRILYDADEARQHQFRPVRWGLIGLICLLGYLGMAWSNIYYGVPRNQAFQRAFITMLLVILIQAPLYLWYRKRLRTA